MELAKSLIEAAGEALRKTPANRDDHTVGAAARTRDGRIFAAVNVHHFTGGPCAEQVVLGVAAAQGALAVDMEMMVAVKAAAPEGPEQPRGTGDKTAMPVKVLNPCGKCRQVMLDYNADMQVVIFDDKDITRVVEIQELLPWSYRAPKD